MELIISLIFFAIGIGMLVKGADWLVSGASSIAASFKISPIVIGLTVVAFGTSAPELIVSVTSALAGNTDIALGNIVGSNIANILLILGISSLLCPLVVQKNTVWKEIPMSLLGAIVITIFALQKFIDQNILLSIPFSSPQIVGFISLSNGIILFAFFIIFLYYTFGIAKVSAESEPEIEKRNAFFSVLFVLLGLILLVFGSKLVVDNGVVMARSLGVSDSLIGLTLVAVGTSLPELMTSVVAAMKKKVDIAVGNVVGSNIFNIFFILGITAFVRPIPISSPNLVDIFVLCGTTILLFILLFIRQRHTISKFEGVLMLFSYLAYLAFLINRG